MKLDVAESEDDATVCISTSLALKVSLNLEAATANPDLESDAANEEADQDIEEVKIDLQRMLNHLYEAEKDDPEPS